VLRHGFPRAEAAGNGGRSAAGNGKKRVDDPLPRDERHAGLLPAAARARPAHRPVGGKPPGKGSRFRLHAEDLVFQRVGSGGNKLRQFSGHTRRHKHPVHDQRAFPDFSQKRSLAGSAAGLRQRLKFPFFLHVQRRKLDAFADVAAARFGNADQRALNAVVDAGDQARPEQNGKRPPVRDHLVPRLESGVVLVHLDDGNLAGQTDHFADQAVGADFGDVEHLDAAQPLGPDDRAVDGNHFSGKHVFHLHSSFGRGVVAVFSLRE